MKKLVVFGVALLAVPVLVTCNFLSDPTLPGKEEICNSIPRFGNEEITDCVLIPQDGRIYFRVDGQWYVQMSDETGEGRSPIQTGGIEVQLRPTVSPDSVATAVKNLSLPRATEFEVSPLVPESRYYWVAYPVEIEPPAVVLALYETELFQLVHAPVKVFPQGPPPDQRSARDPRLTRYSV